MIKIFVLGHEGMLGRSVFKYFSQLDEYVLESTNLRWPQNTFKEAILSSNADFIINCIGKIPQKSDTGDYQTLNIDLPIFLETSGKKVIHPSTDCEFSGSLAAGLKYHRDSVRDARDDYGKSKAFISKKIEEEFRNTKIIRTSIIGHEKSTRRSLLDWFLASEKEVGGYVNHFWNGITTLEWAKQSQKLIEDWNNRPLLTQIGTNTNKSKYELLVIVKEIYQKKISIKKVHASDNINKSLVSDYPIINIENQLAELRDFLKK